jgi:hypothetical protein
MVKCLNFKKNSQTVACGGAFASVVAGAFAVADVFTVAYAALVLR